MSPVHCHYSGISYVLIVPYSRFFKIWKDILNFSAATIRRQNTSQSNKGRPKIFKHEKFKLLWVSQLIDLFAVVVAEL